MSRLKTCRNCGQTIRWVSTTAGRSVALTATPCTDGQICLIRAHGALVAVRARDDHDGERYRIHRAVCPAGALS